MENFTTLNLPPALMASLEAMKFNTPTPIQAQAIPPALEGKDILGSAQTGTGKTGAFGIPLVTNLMNNPRGTALVMTPTRELAVQVMQTLQALLGKRTTIATALLIGGESIFKQLQQMRMRPRLIVGTPGRITDHLERGSLMLHDTHFLVLDETDRMLDMGFVPQIEKIMKFMPAQRQTLLFSATLPANMVAIAQKYLRQPVRVSVGASSTPVAKITQETLRVSETDKYSQLLAQLGARQGSVIIFVKTKWGAEKMAKRLRQDQHNASAIHGDLRQSQRDRVISDFRSQKHRIMVATDIAARGLDIPHIEHVINYDLPQVAEDYIHRIGRTARAGAVGSAISLITPADIGKWREIERMMNPDAPRTHSNHGHSGNHHGGNGGGHAHASSNGNNGNGNGNHKRRRRGGRGPSRPSFSASAGAAPAGDRG